MPATMVRGSGFADIDLHVHQLVGALDALGGEHQADAQIDLDEIVDGDLGEPAGAAGGASGFLPSSFACSAVTFSSSSRILAMASLARCAGTRRRLRRSVWPGRQSAPWQRVEAHRFDRLRSCRAAPRSLAADSGSTGESSAVAMRSASAAV